MTETMTDDGVAAAVATNPTVKTKRTKGRRAKRVSVENGRPVGRRVTERQPAPDVKVIEDGYTDPRKLMEAQARAKMGEHARGMHFFFVSGKQWKEFPERYTDDGAQLAIDPVSGRTWNHRGDPLLMRTEADYQRRVREPAMEAAEQLRDTMQGNAEGIGAVDSDGQRHGLVNEGEEEE